jgi:hypothetical protein
LLGGSEGLLHGPRLLFVARHGFERFRVLVRSTKMPSNLLSSRTLARGSRSVFADPSDSGDSQGCQRALRQTDAPTRRGSSSNRPGPSPPPDGCGRPRQCPRRCCGSSQNCGCGRSHQRQHETFDSHASKSNRREECVRMPRKTARSGPQRHLEEPAMPVSHPLLPSGSRAIQKIASV